MLFLLLSIKIIAVGDICLGTTYPDTVLPRNPYKLFEEVKDVLKMGDIVFGNLEGVLCNDGEPAKIPEKGKSYLFRMPEKYGEVLKYAGFNVLSLANNHSMDFGRYGIEKTKEILKKCGIKYSSKDGEIAEFIINGVKICLMAVSFGAPPRSILYPDRIFKEIKSLKKYYDVIIVSVHGGGEGISFLHIKDTVEYFMGENRGNLLRFAHRAVDAGADLILCHGAHVPRPVEIYKNRLIVYGLGNFCTYGKFNLKGPSGFAPVFLIEINEKGEFLKGKIFSFIQYPPGGPRKDLKNRAFYLIKKLSLEDFGKFENFY